MDVIARTAFGIEVDSQNNPDDPFVKMAAKIFSADVLKSPGFLMNGKYAYA
jgi:hypothetical protein